jgi:hypothetical protein
VNISLLVAKISTFRPFGIARTLFQSLSTSVCVYFSSLGTCFKSECLANIFEKQNRSAIVDD